MITLEQVRLLESKVKAAVAKIAELQAENVRLNEQLRNFEQNNKNLSNRVTTFEAEQTAIEKEILQVLECLNTVEDSVRGEQAAPAPSTPPVPAEDSAPAAMLDLEADSGVSAPQFASGNGQLDIF